jgi:hypothetical protein
MFHFILSGTSSVLLPIGIGLAVLRDAPTLAILASFLFVAGVLIFLAQVISLLRSRDDSLAVAEER